jgi:hypothetical protein
MQCKKEYRSGTLNRNPHLIIKGNPQFRGVLVAGK